ncbi:MAG TPA: ABC transporter permease [Gammaproteobacteria bacterium]|nr:ABC transporter permease [Gammaproteobacteria bacterium]
MIVGTIFLLLIVVLIGSIAYGRHVVRTEKSDAVFGNPIRALGGWHWIVCGVSTIMVVWFLFSWDAARSYFPLAANELCQVAKFNRAGVPMRSTFPLDGNRLLQGTQLLQREYREMDELGDQLLATNFSNANKVALSEIIGDMRLALAAQANENLMDPEISRHMRDIVERIRALNREMGSSGYPGPADPAALAEALAQPGWGETSVEIPPLPMTDRGRKFDAASEVLEKISNDYVRIRNNGGQIATMLAGLKAKIEALDIGEDDDPAVMAARKDMVKQITLIFRRIDDGRIFPPTVLNDIEHALIELDGTQREEQGSLTVINAWAMPGGEILAGNSACSEQGSGRWLPKPSDTLATFFRLANPDEGYKGVSLFWYKMKPVSEMVGFIVPDWIADLVPGEYPRHGSDGRTNDNFKSSVYNFATGDFDSFSVPVPDGHVWDSILRVLLGLFFGILLGVPLGLFMGLSRFAKGYFDPLIELYRPVPPLAWAPLILTIFGIQDDGKIFLLFMVAFAIMVISARTGATGTQLSKIHAAHSLGATPRQIVRRVILPNSLPEILTGIRISIGVCWGTLVAAEMLAGTTGIGFVENVARKQSDYEIIWMTIIILGLLGLLFDLIMRWVIKRTIPWRGKG